MIIFYFTNRYTCTSLSFSSDYFCGSRSYDGCCPLEYCWVFYIFSSFITNWVSPALAAPSANFPPPTLDIIPPNTISSAAFSGLPSLSPKSPIVLNATCPNSCAISCCSWTVFLSKILSNAFNAFSVSRLRLAIFCCGLLLISIVPSAIADRRDVTTKTPFSSSPTGDILELFLLKRMFY